LSLWNSIHDHDLNKIIIQQEEPISLQWIELYKTIAMASLLTLSTTCASTDKICMMTTRLACNWAIESSYWRMDNDSDVGLLMGYVLYWLPVELEFMDLDTFPHWFGLHPSLCTSW
jgi:hypothetical protein